MSEYWYAWDVTWHVLCHEDVEQCTDEADPPVLYCHDCPVPEPPPDHVFEERHPEVGETCAECGMTCQELPLDEA